MRVVLVSLLFVGLAFAKPGKGYTTQYDNINLDEIFNNERLYQKYFKCLANEGTCTADAKTLKDIIPDALEDGCAKCNEKQKAGLEKTMRFLFEKKRADFNKLEKIYDPRGVYKQRYRAEAEKRGIKV